MEKAIYLSGIKSLTFKNFKDVSDISFLKDDNSIYPWTIFLGNNGTGKTNLLRVLSSFGVKNDTKEHPILFQIDISLFNFDWKCTIDIQGNNNTLDKVTAQSGKLGISSNYSDNLNYKKFRIDAYGVNRKASRKNNLSSNETKLNNETIFNSSIELINLTEWLLQTDYASKNNQKSAKKRLNLIKNVITSDIFPEIQDFRFETDENLSSTVKFQTKEGWFEYHDLAYGYQSSLSWIIDFSKKLFDRYPESENPLKEHAVVLIDEIDLHLHPEWQRNITKILSRIFPKTQFIATTHSPLVIQSLEEANVYVLEKEETKVNIAKVNNNNFSGWNVEDILSKVMGMSSRVKSDEYLNLLNDFDKALDDESYKNSKNAYDKLMNILPENDVQRRVLTMQLKQFPEAR